MIIKGNFAKMEQLANSYMEQYKKDPTIKPFLLAGRTGIGKGTILRQALKSVGISYAHDTFDTGISSIEKAKEGLKDIFTYLRNSGRNCPVAEIACTSYDVLAPIAEAGYDVYVLEYNQDLFFDWMNQLSDKGYRNLDKICRDYIVAHPADANMLNDETIKTIRVLSEDEYIPMVCKWRSLMTPKEWWYFSNTLRSFSSYVSDDLYDTLFTDGDIDFNRVKEVLSALPTVDEVDDNHTSAFDEYLWHISSDINPQKEAIISAIKNA